MVAVSSGAILGFRSKTDRMERAISPGLFDAFLIALCWTGALLTSKWGIATTLTLAAWITVGALSSYAIHRSQSSIRRGKRQRKELPGPAADPSGHPQAPSAAEATSKARSRWRTFAGEVGGFQSRLILRAVYYCVFAPFGLSVGLFGDPLNIRSKASASSWEPRESGRPTLQDGRRQF